jgi:drug/metabolite transporter (DMT)-like permease
MALFLRTLVIACGFLLACMAAAFVIAYGLVGPELSDFSRGSPEFFLVLLFLGGAAGVVTPFYVFAPSFAAIFIAEMFSLRSVLYYALAGALIGALAYFLSDVTARMQGAGTVAPITRELQFLAAAGIVGGFVYWLIAGRNAGKWKGI